MREKSAVKQFKRLGFFKQQTQFGRLIYIVRDRFTEVPDKKLVRVTVEGLKLLKGLKPHEAEEMFLAAEVLCGNLIDVISAKRYRAKIRMDKARQPVRKRVLQTHAQTALPM
jgi:hypothetical protein